MKEIKKMNFEKCNRQKQKMLKMLKQLMEIPPWAKYCPPSLKQKYKTIAKRAKYLYDQLKEGKDGECNSRNR